MAYTKTIWEDWPSEDTPITSANLQNIEDGIEATLKMLGLDVDTFNPSTEYKVDDFVVYQKELWRCIEATTGAWNEAKWVKDSILVPTE